MGRYVTLTLTYSTFKNVLDWLMYRASKDVISFDDMVDLVSIVRILEEEEAAYSAKTSEELQQWMKYQKMFKDKDLNELRYHLNFNSIKSIFDKYEENGWLKWEISDENIFYLICEIIDKLMQGEEND